MVYKRRRTQSIEVPKCGKERKGKVFYLWEPLSGNSGSGAVVVWLHQPIKILKIS
jgi:hypothetical protein